MDTDTYDITPDFSELTTKASGDPMKMRGLCHVINAMYKEGMTSDELQTAVATAVQEKLQQYAEALDPESAQIVFSFLQNVDQTLSTEYNRVIKTGRNL